MRPNVNLPSWAKPCGIAAAVLVTLAIWQIAASYGLLVILFKGHPPGPVYPWTWASYVIEYHGNKAVMRPAALAALISGVLIMAGPAWLLLRPRRQSLHGEARLATVAEARGIFLPSGGVIVGKLGDKFLCAPRDVHINVQAPTGGGKGVAIVIPNLLSWDDSAIILDVKKENYQLTAGFRRKHGHKVYLFDPLHPERKTHRWNCFSGVPDDPVLAIEEIQKIAHIWFPDQKDQDPIWSGGSRGLFLGLALFIKETGGHLCLGTLAAEACNGDVERFKTEIAQRKAAGKPLSRVCELSLVDYYSAPDKTRDSIRKTFTSRLELFQNPYIDAATRESDFDIRQLRKERISIYLGAEPTQLPRLAPLYNLFFEQVLAEHTREEPATNPALKHRILLLMDEFAALGKMSQLVRAVSFVRSYNIVLMPIYQARSQLYGIYGEHDATTLFDNLTLHVVYRPNNVKDSEELSKWMGNTTVKSIGRSRATFGGKGGTNSENEVARALFLPQELRELPKDTVLLFMEGLRPVKASKAYYYEKGVLVERLKSVSPTLRALGTKLPDRELLTRVRHAGELSPAVPVAPLAVHDTVATPVNERRTRPVVAGDMGKLDTMSLSDFDLDFSNVSVPVGHIDETRMAEFAESVYRRMFTA